MTSDASSAHPFLIMADGYANLITHIFPEGDEYLDSDAVFGVKNSLVADFKRNDSASEAAKLGLGSPFYLVEFNFGLKPM